MCYESSIHLREKKMDQLSAMSKIKELTWQSDVNKKTSQLDNMIHKKR